MINVLGVNQNGEIVKFDFACFTEHQIINKPVEQQGAGAQVTQDLLNPKTQIPTVDIVEVRKTADMGKCNECQDAYIGVWFKLSQFEQYIGLEYKIFEEMITEGKTFKILDIYKKYL